MIKLKKPNTFIYLLSSYFIAIFVVLVMEEAPLFVLMTLSFWSYFLITTFTTILVGAVIYQIDIRCTADMENSSSFGYVWTFFKPFWLILFVITMAFTNSGIKAHNDYARWVDRFGDEQRNQECINRLAGHEKQSESFHKMTKKLYGEEKMEYIKRKISDDY